MTSQSTLRTLTRDEIRIDPNGKIWTNAQIDGFVNKAYLDITIDASLDLQENQEETTITTAVGTREYNLPADFLRVDSVSIDNRELENTTKKQVVIINTDQTQGQPFEYYLYNNKIGFNPVPNQIFVFNLLYKSLLPTITDSVESELPDRFDSLIAVRAAYYAFRQVRGNEQAAVDKNRQYEEEMTRLMAMYNFNDLNSYYGVARTPQSRGDRALRW